jgi:general secretion pathway protein D
MKTRPINKFLLFVTVAIISLGSPIGSSFAAEESQTETKIRLMAEALRAKNEGDLYKAKENLEALEKIAPGDTSVKRQLYEVNRMIAAQPKTTATPVAAPTSSSSAPSVRAVDKTGESIQRAEELRKLAKVQADRGDVSTALKTYDYALNSLTPGSSTKSLIKKLTKERDSLAAKQAKAAKKAARSSSSDNGYVAESVSASDSSFSSEQASVNGLISKGRSQYLGGDVGGAEATFKEVETMDPDNSEAKNFLRRIAQQKREAGWLNHEKTREQLLEEVTNAWQRPGVYQERESSGPAESATAPMLEKLNSIFIPNVVYNGLELSGVINSLSATSAEFDKSESGPKGVNIVLLDPNQTNPSVNISVRDMSLKRVLDFIVDMVGFQYEVEADAVIVRPGGELTNLDTEFFPVSRSTVIRMAGSGGAAPTTSGSDDPFAPSSSGGSGVSGSLTESEGIQNFLQQAGVNFDSVAGSSLVYDGSAMIVTQTSRNLQRVRNILNRYNQVRQVEIEAKFIDVAEGDLEEFGIEWKVDEARGNTNENYQSVNRNLADAFGTSSEGLSELIIDGVSTSIIPPSLPGGIDLASATGALGVIGGSIGEFNVDATVRALSRQSGSDLLSAPKVTVLSGNKANITVAQEFRYPETYGDIESQVGTGNASGGGSAGVAITAGTPQDFQTRRVGVELDVTPTVEEDNYSISLDLNPRVTEFEGFVEYGGPSIAVTAAHSVSVPSGFFQPIFTVREINTKVTIWDGATVVMGGLTREEVKTVNDKVPVLGDVPLLGRLFRSEGETSQKRNLLIFVTANLVSPGGSPKKQSLKNVQSNSLFQNPTIVTPGGSVDRTKE